MSRATRDLLSLALLAALAAGCGLFATPPAAVVGTAVPFEALSYDAPATPPAPSKHENFRIRSQAALAQFLNALAAPASGRPQVDFSTKEVLALYEAGGNSACSDHRLIELKDFGSELRFVNQTPDEMHPGLALPCAAVMVMEGYDLYAIARTDKPIRQVVEYPVGP